MKFRQFFYVLTSLSILTSACSESETGDNDTLPEGALPSSEFILNNLPDEPYAEDAVCIVALKEEYNSPFRSLELMPDGYYLLSVNNYHSTYDMAADTEDNDRKAGAKRTRVTTDENGTMSFYNNQYGKFVKVGDRRYLLSNGMEIDLKDITGSNKCVHYRLNSGDGTVMTVKVGTVAHMQGNATKSLCRTWSINSYEVWAYWRNMYVAHGWVTVEDEQIKDSHFKSIGDIVEEDDFFDGIGYKEIFLSTGKHITFFIPDTSSDNEIAEISDWKWDDESQGIIIDYDADKSDADVEHWTIRFFGNQMRIYEDIRDYEDGEYTRTVGVATLTAASGGDIR